MGIRNILNAVVNNNPVELEKELVFFKLCNKEDFDLNQVVQKNEQRLLHIAVRHGSEMVLLYLIDPYVDINITDCKGNTPAHYAILYRQPKILQLLKNAGADFSKKNKDGHTLHHFIQSRPQKEENKRIKKELEEILATTSDLTVLADVAIQQIKIPSKRKMVEEEILSNKIQRTRPSFFHNLPREIDSQSQALDLTSDKPLDLSITPYFKK